MFGQGFNSGFFADPPCFTDTTDIFKDKSGVALYTLDYDASDAGGATGNFNEGVVLNGANDVSIPGSILGDFHNAGTHAISVSTWVYWAGTTSESYAHVISAGYNQSGKAFWVGIGYSSSVGTSGVSNELYVSGPSVSADWTGVSMPLNQWSHVVFTWTGTSSKLYLNKTLIATTTHPTLDWRSSGNGFRLGRYYYNSNYFLKGTYDQTRIFNRAITQAEVNTLNSETDATTGTLQTLGDSSCKATYMFDGNLNDLSGNYNATSSGIFKYNGAPSNVDFGVGGKSLYGAGFNGSNSYVDLPLTSTFGGKNTFTVSLWFKTTTTTRSRIFTDYAQTSRNCDIILDSDGTIEVTTDYNQSSNLIYNSTTTYNDNNWHHISVSLNQSASQRTIYIDGSLVNTGTLSSNSWSGYGQKVTAGAFYSSSSGYSQYFDGKIDQLRVFNKVLSSSEVSKLYGNGAGEIACEHTATTTDVNYPVTNLAYYKLDNSSKDSGKSRGKFNQGATFIGNSAGIVNTTLQLSSTAHSVSLWMKPQDLTATKWQIMFFSAFNGYPSFTLGKRPDKTTAFHYRNESSQEVYFTLSSADTWYHVVVTRNNSGSTVYVNGSSVATDSNSMGTYSSSAYQKASIGSNPLYPAEYFDGTLDQIRVYNVALTATDVANLYNNETTTTAGTLSFPTGKTAIATYKLDGDGVDISGNYSGNEGTNIVYGYDGTETNVEYRFGKYGQAAVFNGSSSRINLPVGLGTTGARSNSLWIKVDTFPSSGIDAFFYLGTQSANENYETISVTSTSKVKFQQRVGSATDMTAIESSETIIAGNWYHIATTHDGTTAKLYINGDLSKGGSVSFSSYVNNSSLTGNLGAFRTLTPSFDGSIDQYRRFHTALSAANVTSLYNEKPEPDTSNFKAVLWKGNNTTGHFISNVGIDLETNGGLVWIKSRNDTDNHILQDSVRGITNYIMSSSNAQQYGSDMVVSLEKTGFILGADTPTGVNTNNINFVSWVWKGGGDAVTGSGSNLTSISRSTNTGAGFSIVRYTSSGTSGASFSHGLGATPDIVIIKCTSTTGNWITSITNVVSDKYLYLNNTGTGGTGGFAVDGTNVTLNNTYGDANTSGRTYIAYCWHSVAGYSKIGSYSGSGVSGKEVTLDFNPSFVLIKRTDGTAGWVIVDDKRGTKELYPNVTNQEDTSTTNIALGTNKFTLNSTGTWYNASGGTYLYMAFK